jgi:hypothetical protein
VTALFPLAVTLSINYALADLIRSKPKRFVQLCNDVITNRAYIYAAGGDACHRFYVCVPTRHFFENQVA